MRLLQSRVFVPAIIAIELLLGLRGLWHTEKDFFTMHPYGSPRLACRVQAMSNRRPITLPAISYRAMSGNLLMNSYIELLPLYAGGLTTMLRRVDADAEVQITCQTLNGFPMQTYTVP